MELVAAGDRARPPQRGVRRQLDLAVGEREAARPHPHRRGQDADHRVRDASSVLENGRQVHEAPALGIDRPVGGGEPTHGLSHARVAGELPGVELGVAAADVETVHLRQRRVLGWAPEDQVGARGAEAIEVLRIVELKRAVPRDAEADSLRLRPSRAWGRHPAAPARARHALVPPGLDGSGKGQEAVEVDVLLDGAGQRVTERGRDDALGAGDEAEVALGQREVVAARQEAHRHRAAGPLERVGEPLRVPVTADPVEDHGREAERGIEPLEAEDDRPRAPRQRPGVHHEHHRRAQPFRDLRGRAVLALSVEAVEAAHHALHQRQIGAGRLAGDRLADVVARAHPAVEVVRGPAAHDRVEARIDEVGADFERLRHQAAPTERLEEAERDRRLADPARDARDHEEARSTRPSGGVVLRPHPRPRAPTGAPARGRPAILRTARPLRRT